ncbi:MAG: hypothetical protein H0V39_05685 [Nitrosomonas sp.]|nr:hypothetical protein [Nitrosomonas sp.]
MNIRILVFSSSCAYRKSFQKALNNLNTIKNCTHYKMMAWEAFLFRSRQRQMIVKCGCCDTACNNQNTVSHSL